MTELARFLRDLMLHPTLRERATSDLRGATTGYALDPDELALLEAGDWRLLDAIGEAVRAEPVEERPAQVERLETPTAPALLDAARLWLRLAPYQGLDGAVTYAVGVIGQTSSVPPALMPLDGQPLPPLDLDVTVQPMLAGTRVAYSTAVVPRGRPLPPPGRARSHRSPGDALVQAAVAEARQATDRYGAVIQVIDALLQPGGDDTPPPGATGEPLTILGTGMLFPDHVTLEAEAAIRAAREVIVVDTGIATLDWLRARCPNVTPLLQSAYVEGDTRLHTYHHFVATTIAAALDHAPVVFAMSGHPLVSAYAPFLLLDVAAAFGIPVRVQPGISSLDAIFAALRIDPLLTGLQLHEATDLVLQRRPLQPDLPALILQVGTVGTLLHSDRKRNATAFAPLRDHLLRIYPPDHRVTAVHISPHPLVPDERLSVPLSDLSSLAPRLHAGFSLWVPAVHDRPLADAAGAAGLSDPDALEGQLG